MTFVISQQDLAPDFIKFAPPKGRTGVDLFIFEIRRGHDDNVEPKTSWGAGLPDVDDLLSQTGFSRGMDDIDQHFRITSSSDEYPIYQAIGRKWTGHSLPSYLNDRKPGVAMGQCMMVQWDDLESRDKVKGDQKWTDWVLNPLQRDQSLGYIVKTEMWSFVLDDWPYEKRKRAVPPNLKNRETGTAMTSDATSDPSISSLAKTEEAWRGRSLREEIVSLFKCTVS